MRACVPAVVFVWVCACVHVRVRIGVHVCARSTITIIEVDTIVCLLLQSEIGKFVNKML